LGHRRIFRLLLLGDRWEAGTAPSPGIGENDLTICATLEEETPSLRAKRSNPVLSAEADWIAARLAVPATTAA
jgi:hypothetical protein